jgi:ABC-type antimicrobial peptide transport system permease subunit
MSDHVARSLVQQRLIARLSSFFGLLALLLACIGLFGIMSFSVARRTNEIGIRMALGAKRGDVLRLVMREGLAPVLIGVALGLPAALLGARLITSLLFGLTPADPLTVCAATILLLAIAGLAGYLPARKASRVDPMTALRCE